MAAKVRLVFSAAALLCATQAIGAPGDLDTSFGTGGVTTARIDYTTSTGSVSDGIATLLIQPDGKILAIGGTFFTYTNTAIARFNPDGTLDTSFAGTGKAVHSMSSWNDAPSAAALQSDGKILIAGYASSPSNGTQIYVCRMNTDGSLDHSFSEDGVVYLVGWGVNGVGIQPDGKIIVAGRAAIDTSLPYSMIVRLNTNGTLDSNFSGVQQYNRNVQAMQMLPDGRFLVAGSYTPDNTEFQHWVAMYGVGGALQGETITATAPNRGPGTADDYGSIAQSVAVDPDGNIWTSGVGIGGESNVLVRYGSSLGSGTVTALPQGLGARIVIQPNGKLLVLGGTFPDALARYDLSPQLDSSFSGDGITEHLHTLGIYSAKGIACQGNGGVFIGGTSGLGHFAVARFLTDGNPPSSITLAPAEVSENLPAGTLVGILSAQDPDPGDTLEFVLAGGAGDTHNAQFGIVGNQVFTVAPLNFEEAETRSIRIRVTDSTEGVHEAPVAITILDDLSEDIDGDGLTQAVEKQYGSSDFSTDSDADGLGDYNEVHVYHSSPGSADSDGDGVRDNDELTRGTGITNPDSDADGLRDGDEITRGADPLNPDTDGDGFLDGYEVQTGKSPTDPADKPALLAEIRTAIEFSFPTATGKTYRIEASPDMTAWSAIEENITGTGSAITRFYTTRNMPKRFLRVEEQTAP